MNVLYDHTIFTIQRFGGISRYFAEIIPRIATTPDMSVSLCMGFHINDYALEQHRHILHRLFAIRRPELRRTHKLALVAGNFALRRFARSCKPNIVHFTGSGTTKLPVATRRVITIHDMTPQRVPQFFGRAAEIDTEAKRQAVLQADGIICVSQNTRRDLIELLGVAQDRVVCIYHGATDLPTPAAERPLPQRYVLFVGQRYGYKNFDALLKAWSTTPHLARELDIVAFGGQPFTRNELAHIDPSLLSHVHHRRGSDQVLSTLYSHAEVFVFPSFYEGFGIPLLEAMRCRCPIVAANASSLPEIAGPAARYFDPLCPEELAAQLTAIIGDNALRQSLVDAGTQRQLDFTWSRCASATASFYRTVSSS